MVTPWATEVLPGVVLDRSDRNSHIVHVQGRPVGYLHACAGAAWRANLMLPGGGPSVYLGTFDKLGAVGAIAQAAPLTDTCRAAAA